MNRISRLSLACVVLGGSLAGSAYADPVTINITGNVLAAPCVVDGTGSINVDLGDIPAPDLAAADSSSPWKAFNLTVKSCPAGTSKVTATFSGTPDVDGPKWRYLNTGTATGVGVELARNTAINLPNGTGWEVTVDSTRSATWPMRTRMVAMKGNAIPGTVKAVVVVSLTYQ
ncbi:putative fimbrial protein SthD [Serratia quinivorans]|uniref:fimbrial protein n=1 Tax=Serratia quinivorans TaxID=137545 RepID=UPI00217BB1D2|nr:fimbrial protein [Serratia quinivorans]CAI1072320.1 putative fimbrial protein SthD [Serratia quinivorans]